MGIRTGWSDATTSVSRTRLRVGLVVVDPFVSVTPARPAVSVAGAHPAAAVQCVLAATSVAYVDLTLGVVVDTNGFYKLFGDTVGVADVANLAVSKSAADQVALADGSVRDTIKALADTSTADDFFSRIVGYARAFADARAISDSAVFATDKPLTDDASVVHAEVFSHAKLLADGVAMNDGMEAVDGFGIALTRSVSNVTLVADAADLSFTRSSVESVVTADAGALRSQGYCDISYFAEDYVGASRAF